MSESTCSTIDCPRCGSVIPLLGFTYRYKNNYQCPSCGQIVDTHE